MRGLEKILIGMYEMERPVLEEVLPSHAVDPEVLPQRVSTTRLLASEEDVTKVLEAAGAAIPEKSVRLRDIYFDGRGRELRERGLYVRTREEVQPGTLQGNGEERGSDQGPDKCWELRSVGGVLIRGEEEVTRTLDIGLDELRPVAEVVTNRALHRGSRVQFSCRSSRRARQSHPVRERRRVPNTGRRQGGEDPVRGPCRLPAGRAPWRKVEGWTSREAAHRCRHGFAGDPRTSNRLQRSDKAA